MEAKAQARFVRVTPQKARRVVDLIRGKQAEQAVATLRFAPQAAGETVLKVVEAATSRPDELGPCGRPPPFVAVRGGAYGNGIVTSRVENSVFRRRSRRWTSTELHHGGGS